MVLNSLLLLPNLATKCFIRCYAIKSATSTGLMGLGKGKKAIGKGATVEKIELPVETDANKLVNYLCGSNINLTGEDIKLKPNSEYPDWLWELRTGPAPKLEEMDPDTKEYWLKVRREARHKKNMIKNLKLKRY